ncbi:MAG: hypothetical protein WCI18_10080 [Pseudomonadota bacterium]
MKSILGVIFWLTLASCGDNKTSPDSAVEAIFYTSQNQTYKAKLVFDGKIKSVESLTADFIMEPNNGAILDSVSLESFKPTMPSMGHGTDTSNLAFEPSTQIKDRVKVKGIWFNMGGPWEISISAKLNGVSDQVTIKVEVP